MREITVGVDIDDTICVLAHEIDNEVQRRYDVRINRDEYYLGARYECNGRKLSAGLIRKIMYNHVDWDNLTASLEAIKYIKKLQKRKAHIVFITNRSGYYTPNCEETTERWLNKYYNNYELYFTKDKLRFCDENNIDYLIDNSHKILLARPSVKTQLLFFTGIQPTTIKDVGLTRYNTWESIFNCIIEKETKKK